MEMSCDVPYYAVRTLQSQQYQRSISQPSCTASLGPGPWHVSVLAMGSAMPPECLLPDLDPPSPLTVTSCRREITYWSLVFCCLFLKLHGGGKQEGHLIFYDLSPLCLLYNLDLQERSSCRRRPGGLWWPVLGFCQGELDWPVMQWVLFGKHFLSLLRATVFHPAQAVTQLVSCMLKIRG